MRATIVIPAAVLLDMGIDERRRGHELYLELEAHPDVVTTEVRGPTEMRGTPDDLASVVTVEGDPVLIRPFVNHIMGIVMLRSGHAVPYTP